MQIYVMSTGFIYTGLSGFGTIYPRDVFPYFLLQTQTIHMFYCCFSKDCYFFPEILMIESVISVLKNRLCSVQELA